MMVQTNNEVYELTPTQQAMLIYSLYAPESKAYFEQVCYSYQGPLDSRVFARAWQQVVDRHAILRTCFFSDDSEHMQRVQPHASLPFQYHDWRELSTAKQREQLEKFLERDSGSPFDLSKPPLIRIAVLQTDEDAYWIVISNHHIVLDGWSMSVVRDEVSQLYRELIHNKEPDLEPPFQFGEYLKWRERFAQRNPAAEEKFWRRELDGFVWPNYLPIDKSAGKLSSPDEQFEEKQVSLPPSATNAIKSCAKRHHLTVSTLLQGAWAVLLSRYCNTDDVAFGITVSGRPYDLAGIESMVGLLINTLPVRMEMSEQETCLSCLKKLQSKAAELLEHEHSSLTQIQECSDLPRNLPLFETLLVVENFAGSGSSLDLDGPMRLLSSHLSRTNYPLTLVVDPADELRLQLVYHSSRFADEAIEKILAHLGNILQAMVSNIEQPIAGLQLLSDKERQTLLTEWNSTALDFPKGKPINRLFEQQVELTPEALALINQNQQLTYSELNSQANQLAHYLKELGVGPGCLVGICVERSVEMMVAVLATLKAGGAYVPLDPTYPQNRLAFMLSDSGVQVLLTQDRMLQELPNYSGTPDQGVTIVRLDKDVDMISSCSRENLSTAAAATDLAYVIYTSGSTGDPKGVMIEHRSLVNFTLAAADEYAISPNDRVLQFASLSFDTSAEEVFPALITGATVVLRTDTMLSSAADFLGSCAESGVTVLDLPTAYWHELTDEICSDNLSLPSSLRLLILGGEKALPERLASWQARIGHGVRLINTYGPTETTVVATMCDVSAEIGRTGHSEIPIGRPISNVTVYILDRHLNPVPVGVPGEIYIGGAGVARGYLHRPELTAEKFIANPFGNERAPRLYRTGDVACYQPDGNIEFLGRLDNQVKVRGFRIELEEIEQAIGKYGSVSDAVVIVQDEDSGDRRLVAYVVATSGAHPTASELREFLAAKLPAYMVPGTFVMIETLPLMPNGKIDRQSLPRLGQGRPALDASFESPRSPLEESVARVWCDLLKLERVGIHDNFFELGGHSLMGARLISNLRRRLDINLNLIDVFQSPTVARLAELIYQRQTEEAADGELTSLLAELENLSDEEAQQRLAAEIGRGGRHAHALKLALIATGSCALQILSEAL